MRPHIHEFHCKVQAYYHQTQLGRAFTSMGKNIENAEGISIENLAPRGGRWRPTPLTEIIHHADSVAVGITELFVIKTIAAWSDLLTALLGEFLRAHLAGPQRHPGLASKKATINFSSHVPVLDQIYESILVDYSLSPYDVRIKTITKLCVPSEPITAELDFVRKHVEIRNSFEHHAGMVTAKMLKNLGTANLQVVDDDGFDTFIELGQPIRLTITELSYLKGSVMRITQRWRMANRELLDERFKPSKE